MTDAHVDRVNAPLADLTVVDCAWLMPGQFCAMILADLGARVIKIELPRVGDYSRHFDPHAWASLNRAKEGLTLDLRRPGGANVLHRLIRRADVFIEGFRPSVASRLDAGYETLSAINPGLVYCSVSGFGQQGPHRDRAAHGLNYAGISGMLTWAGPSPRFAANMTDLAAALYAVISVVTCLRHRDRSGVGQHVDLSLTDASYGLMTAQLASESASAETFSDEGAPGSYGVFSCGDGRQVTLGAVEEHFWRALCSVVDRPEWLTDPRFVDDAARHHHRHELREELGDVLRGRTAAEWLAAFHAADIPAGPLNGYDDAREDPYATSRQLVTWLDEAEIGRVAQVRFPALFSTLRTRPAARAPRVGEHTEPLLREMGYTDDQIDKLRSDEAV